MAKVLKKLDNGTVAGAYIYRQPDGVALGVVVDEKGARILKGVAFIQSRKGKTVLDVDKNKLDELGIDLNIINE